MVQIIVACCCSLPALLLATLPAWAQLPDNMQRAAYCSGVLQHRVENFVIADPVPDDVCLRWQEQHHSSRDDCIRGLRRAVLATFQQKLQRYLGYLESEMAQRAVFGSGSSNKLVIDFAQIQAIQNKGRRDAEDVKINGQALYERCTRHGCDNRCVIDCVAQVHPTAANVLRCAMLPDDLPY
jgi:hypothetical protein